MQPADTAAFITVQIYYNDKLRGRRRASRGLIAKILTSLSGAGATSTSVATTNASLNNFGVGNILKLKGAKTISRYFSTWSDIYLRLQPTYPASVFRKLFRVPRTLFLKLKSDFLTYDPNFWSTRTDGIFRPGIRSEVKILAFLRLLGSERSLDDMEDCAKTGKETSRMYFKRFWVDVKKIYDDLYIHRTPTQEELCEMEEKYNKFGFLGCFGAVDCMKMKWKNFPHQLKEHFHNSFEVIWQQFNSIHGQITTYTSVFGSRIGAVLKMTKQYFPCLLCS